ncbi:hypothetical protein PR202_ga16158 [Eleusine coracana subsp. coracana]|uniref:WRKY domain-containing protein n=1 Tax=Eleusine coracana subsp. coracana TaxID=191504 RepID=A0AAV5CM39_ELECO|nr:hypothetical protein PR202_ga16158 [Eleusine coracana subsp. coracana]
MTSLRTLGCIDLTTDSMENLQNLSMLTNLQDIRLTCRSTALETSSKNKMLDHLLTIMGTLGNLRSLITLVSKAFPHASSSDSADSQKRSFSNHGFSRVHIPAHIQRLEFSPRICIFSSLSNFIGQLHKLRFLKIGINKIIAGDIDILRRLPSLTILSLYVHTKLAERIVIGKDGFSVLKHFKLKSCDPWLIFEMDAMSNLQKLKLGFNARRGDQRTIMPVGMERLSGLKEVSVKIGGATSPEASDRRTAESAFRDAIRLHARCPRVTILYVNEIIGSMDDETSIKREENYARNYYRCSSRPCNARKTVQRIDRDPPLFDVRYSGEHSCLQPKNSNDQRSGDEQPRATHSNDQESGATAATEAAEEEFPLPSTPPRC